MPEAFYVRDGESFRSTELTRGPWDPDSQHAGPPAALLGRAIESCGLDSPDERQVGRITFEVLRSVPIAPLGVETQVVRPGRRVDMVEGRLLDADGELVRARAWRVARSRIELPAGLASEERGSPARASGRPSGGSGPPAGVPQETESEFFPTEQEVGYHTAMEYRFERGGFLEPGPATTWMRMRHPLIDGEQVRPLDRVLIAADSGNGISATLDFRRYLFINVDLTVHLHRMPATEWVCLDAITIPEPTGLGLADTALYDEHGPIGRAVQTLLIAERDR